MRSLLAILLLSAPLLALAQDPVPHSRVVVLPETRIEGRSAEFLLLPRSRDHYEAPPLVRRDLPHEIVRTVRNRPF